MNSAPLRCGIERKLSSPIPEKIRHGLIFQSSIETNCQNISLRLFIYLNAISYDVRQFLYLSNAYPKTIVILFLPCKVSTFARAFFMTFHAFYLHHISAASKTTLQLLRSTSATFFQCLTHLLSSMARRPKTLVEKRQHREHSLTTFQRDLNICLQSACTREKARVGLKNEMQMDTFLYLVSLLINNFNSLSTWQQIQLQ